MSYFEVVKGGRSRCSYPGHDHMIKTGELRLRFKKGANTYLVQKDMCKDALFEALQKCDPEIIGIVRKSTASPSL